MATLSENQRIFTRNLAIFLLWASDNGYNPQLREVQRTEDQQAVYVQKGLSKTLNSQHLKSLAADIYFSKDDKIIENKADLEPLGAYWESLHKANRWGGNFKTLVDCPHFELYL